MTNFKRIGIIIIIVGAFIPSVLYPLTSLTPQAMLVKVALLNERVPYDSTFRDLEVVLVKGELKPAPANSLVDEIYTGINYEVHFEGRIATPYKYILVFGIALVFIGISLFTLSRKEKIQDGLCDN